MTSQTVYDTIVVGAGAAGLTAAAYLAKGGHRVLLCEKNAKVGGLVSSFTREAFVFDAGVRAFEDSGILRPMLRQLGIELPMVQNPVTLAIGNDQVRLTGPESLADYVSAEPLHHEQNKQDHDGDGYDPISKRRVYQLEPFDSG